MSIDERELARRQIAQLVANAGLGLVVLGHRSMESCFQCRATGRRFSARLVINELSEEQLTNEAAKPGFVKWGDC